MKKWVGIIVTLLIASGIGLTALVFLPTTQFEEPKTYFIIREANPTPDSVIALLQKKKIIANRFRFSTIASLTGLWGKIKPGKYEVRKGQNPLSIIRMLRNARQTEIKLVINRIRTKQELARLIGSQFSTDSASAMHFLLSNDSLAFIKTDTTGLFTKIIPNTYYFYWNTPLRQIMDKLHKQQQNFWKTNNRLEKAAQAGLAPEQVYILASIVDEETNYKEDKYKIASVYKNRLNQSMPLQACPTIKFAMGNFSLTRIYEKYLTHPSPYNTYRVKGLPPGPICTPSPATIDIVLNAPQTNYLYFVAKSDFSGYHHFSSTYQEHNQHAKAYQRALDSYLLKKNKLQNQSGDQTAAHCFNLETTLLPYSKK